MLIFLICIMNFIKNTEQLYDPCGKPYHSNPVICMQSGRVSVDAGHLPHEEVGGGRCCQDEIHGLGTRRRRAEVLIIVNRSTQRTNNLIHMLE